ncbi:hypothetical protein JJB09_21910 [Rhizobium sp. KVB221]|uniref:Uncharacterized protein n=1 Tax=Rhizobium setariae TaxID=2801340 RepID=A0A936YS20_9HYPH|nr:hypothetical protein [Rhizobium setariae]MBL0374673.1 hypothetical protein [Rhizobium setariae]
MPVILRIGLAAILLVPGLIGLAGFCFLLSEWVDQGFGFASDRWLMALFVIAALCAVSFSVLTVGIILRFARWKKAAKASLVLSVIAVLTIVLGYQMLLDALGPDDAEGPTMAFIASAAALILIAAPPFLHWFRHVEIK